MRLYAIPWSTNVERVTLALAWKGLATEVVQVDSADRSVVRRVSGQDLVPVLEDDETVVFDSTEILRYLESRYPDPPLFPADPARRAEMEIFLDWFNRVWKRPPNEIEAELKKPQPDRSRIARMGEEMVSALDRFEGLLDGRRFLLGAKLSAADCAAWPFLKYGLGRDLEDRELFHEILERHQPIGERHPRLAGWIRRVPETVALS